MSMANRDGFIWQDGKLVPWREATTHVLTHTLHYGMGVFEGIRAYKAAKGTSLNHFHEKLFLLKDRMNTVSGRALSVTYDYQDVFIRLARDNKVNFSPDDQTRLSVGLRF